jgi:hypothetical protein
VSRVNITLDEHTRAELCRRAQAAGEPVAQMAARFVRDGLLSTQVQNAAEPPADPVELKPPTDTASEGLPAWLQPPEEQGLWRRALWAQVCALAERYPDLFAKLVADWWTDRTLVEMLGALSLWRSRLDAGELPDPRAEFLFQDRLELLERRFTQGSDPTAARFDADSPPSEWLA